MKSKLRTEVSLTSSSIFSPSASVKALFIFLRERIEKKRNRIIMAKGNGNSTNYTLSEVKEEKITLAKITDAIPPGREKFLWSLFFCWKEDACLRPTYLGQMSLEKHWDESEQRKKLWNFVLKNILLLALLAALVSNENLPSEQWKMYCDSRLRSNEQAVALAT